MFDVLPSTVIQHLQDHLRLGCESAEQGWDAGRDEEDTLTGDLGASLRCPWRFVADDAERIWQWRMSYKKFRGRGKDAAEKHIGADGILQIEVENPRDGQCLTKGLLFQSKKIGSKDRRKLREQTERMESLAPGSSSIFEYGPDHYLAWDAPPAEQREMVFQESDRQQSRLGNYLAERFLPCKVGRRGLFYDAVRQILFVPHETQGVILIKAILNHRLRIEVRPT